MGTNKNVEETELANYDLLENTSNIAGANARGAGNTASVTKSKDRSYSNADAETYAKAGEATVNLLAQLAANKAAKEAAMANTGCKKPILMIGKKRTEYQRCLAIAQQNAEAKQAAADQLAREQMASNERMAGAGSNANAGGNAPKKFLGMDQSVGIAVTVIGSLALLVGGFILIKKFGGASPKLAVA